MFCRVIHPESKRQFHVNCSGPGYQEYLNRGLCIEPFELDLDPQSPHVFIVRYGGAGDILHALRPAQRCAEKHGKQIHFGTAKQFGSVVDGQPHIVSVAPFEGQIFARSYCMSIDLAGVPEGTRGNIYEAGVRGRYPHRSALS